MVATSFLNPSGREPNTRPSLSIHRRSRRSGFRESTIDFDSAAGSPVRFSLPLREKSQPQGINRTIPRSFIGAHPYALSYESGMAGSDASLAAENGWRNPDPTDSHWGEIYSSGGGERIRAVAGPSRRVLAIEPFLNLDDSDQDGAVMSVGTGRSRLLTNAATRPSILSRDEVATSAHPSTTGFLLSPPRDRAPSQTAVDPILVSGAPRTPPSPPPPGIALEFGVDRHQLSVAAQEVGGLVDQDAESRKRRITQLVEALMTPPTATSPVSPIIRSPSRRPGYI